MEIIVSNAIVGLLIIIAYTLGLNNGNGGKVIPKVINNAIHPIKTVKNTIENIKAEEKAEKELEEFNNILLNIENYNGSEEGQVAIK